MKRGASVWFAAVLSVAAGVGVVGWWVSLDRSADILPNVPGMDDPDGRRARDARARTEQTVQYGEIYEIFDTGDLSPSGRWPRFRGPDLNSTSPQSIDLADSFPEEGPPRLWSVELGPGYGGAAVFGGAVYVMDHTKGTGDVLRCFALEDGQELWRCGYRIDIPVNHGITRTVPAVTDKYVVTLGPMGQVMCVDRPTGKARWGKSLMREYGTRDLSRCWYAGQCPLVEDGVAIIAPAGGDVLMMAVSCESGEVLWTAPNRNGWRMSHSSITPMTVKGTRMYVYASVGGVTAVGAEGEQAGRILWETDEWTASVVMPSPVLLENSRVFLTSGYDGGNALLEIVRQGEEFAVEIIYNYVGRRKARDCFSSYQQTPIYHDGHLFGIQLNSATRHRMEFVCADPNQEGGEILWGSGKETVLSAPRKQEAWGPYILADGKFYVLSDTGMLVMFAATTQGCQKLGEWQLLEDGHETWGPMAVVDGRLFVRDYSELVCFDVR